MYLSLFLSLVFDRLHSYCKMENFIDENLDLSSMDLIVFT